MPGCPDGSWGWEVRVTTFPSPNTPNSPKGPAPVALNHQDTAGPWDEVGEHCKLGHHLSQTPLAGAVPSPVSQHWHRIREISVQV